MKKQVWLQPDQVELTVRCLRFVHDKLDEGTVLSDAHKIVAGPYTYARIEELIAIFEPADTPS